MRETLNDEMHVDFFESWEVNLSLNDRLADYSVYQFVRGIEDRLLPPSKVSRPSHQRSGSHSNSTYAHLETKRPKENPSIDWYELFRSIPGVFKGVVHKQRDAEVERIMHEAEAFIQKRQDVRARALIEWRDQLMSEWMVEPNNS
jgi:hypothetical protein